MRLKPFLDPSANDLEASSTLCRTFFSSFFAVFWHNLLIFNVIRKNLGEKTESAKIGRPIATSCAARGCDAT